MSERVVPSQPDDTHDTALRFVADFGVVLDAKKVSLRRAEVLSGWGKSTIGAARRGPDLPNVEMVVDVLAAIGESDLVQQEWRVRHERLSAEKISKASSASGEKPDQIGELNAAAAGSKVIEAGWRRRPMAHVWLKPRLLVIGLLLAALGGGGWFWISRAEKPVQRTIVIQNKVAFGESALQEDRTPYFLSTRPIARCASVIGCKMTGTDLQSGDTVIAVCQLQGALLTNADVRSQDIENNPNVAGSALWYGVRWNDGRFGYVSEVYVAPMYRGGLQLPPC